jgi:hypothetical protein
MHDDSNIGHQKHTHTPPPPRVLDGRHVFGWNVCNVLLANCQLELDNIVAKQFSRISIFLLRSILSFQNLVLSFELPPIFLLMMFGTENLLCN